MTEPATTVVFNCNILLQCILNDKGTAYKCKQLVDDGRAVLVLSPYILGELRDLPLRPKLRRFNQLTPQRTDAFIAELLATARLVPNVAAVFTYARDPDDAHYVNLALATGADYLVSWDNDLLDLMDARRSEGRDFQQRFPSLKIVNPPGFLRSLGY
jgi:putative PIN family toxin of toxin-antitoxin system